MTIDSEGNVYLCENGVLVYDAAGQQADTINVPDQVTNACFGGSDNSTLFITTRSGLYSIAMSVSGVKPYENNETVDNYEEDNSGNTDDGIDTDDSDHSDDSATDNSDTASDTGTDTENDDQSSSTDGSETETKNDESAAENKSDDGDSSCFISTLSF